MLGVGLQVFLLFNRSKVVSVSLLIYDSTVSIVHYSARHRFQILGFFVTFNFCYVGTLGVSIVLVKHINSKFSIS